MRTLPPLPSRAQRSPAASADWMRAAIQCGYEQTGNGFFVFWALHQAIEDVDAQGALHVPEWIWRALVKFGASLETAKGVAEVAGAIGMRGHKTSARDARAAYAWFENAFRAAMVEQAMTERGLTRPEALADVAEFLDFEGTPTNPEALRKRIERFTLGETPTALPADPFGRTGPK